MTSSMWAKIRRGKFIPSQRCNIYYSTRNTACCHSTACIFHGRRLLAPGKRRNQGLMPHLLVTMLPVLGGRHLFCIPAVIRKEITRILNHNRQSEANEVSLNQSGMERTTEDKLWMTKMDAMYEPICPLKAGNLGCRSEDVKSVTSFLFGDKTFYSFISLDVFRRTIKVNISRMLRQTTLFEHSQGESLDPPQVVVKPFHVRPEAPDASQRLLASLVPH